MQIVINTTPINIIQSYKDVLNGKIEFDIPDRSENIFKGRFQLESDPKGEMLTFKNIVLRGSKLKHTDW